MNENVTEDRSRPRPEPRLAEPIGRFDLAQEIASLRAEPAWQSHGHNARTLVKRADSRVVLTLLRSGQRLKSHAVDSSATIQVLEGSVVVHAAGEEISLAVHGLVALEAGMPHDLEARTDAVILVSI